MCVNVLQAEPQSIPEALEIVEQYVVEKEFFWQEIETRKSWQAN